MGEQDMPDHPAVLQRDQGQQGHGAGILEQRLHQMHDHVPLRWPEGISLDAQDVGQVGGLSGSNLKHFGRGSQGAAAASRQWARRPRSAHAPRLNIVQAAYWASPSPNDQFSFLTSTRLMNTSAVASANAACRRSAMAR